MEQTVLKVWSLCAKYEKLMHNGEINWATSVYNDEGLAKERKRHIEETRDDISEVVMRTHLVCGDKIDKKVSILFVLFHGSDKTTPAGWDMFVYSDRKKASERHEEIWLENKKGKQNIVEVFIQEIYVMNPGDFDNKK